MFNNILIVCVGNICRSPTGERALKRILPAKNITSAGIAAEKSRLIGKGADDMALQIASRYELDLNGHQSQQLTTELCRSSDLILAMEKKHIDAISQIAPEARGKTMLFGQWLGGIEIPDPYRQSQEAFEHVYQLIDKAASEWAKKLG